MLGGAADSWARDSHGAARSTWIGSSTVRPHVCTAKVGPGSTKVRVGWSCSSMWATASRQLSGRSAKPSSALSEPLSAGPVVASTSVASTATAATLRQAPERPRPPQAGAARGSPRRRRPARAGVAPRGRTCGCSVGAPGTCRGRAARPSENTDPAHPPLPAVRTRGRRPRDHIRTRRCHSSPRSSPASPTAATSTVVTSSHGDDASSYPPVQPSRPPPGKNATQWLVPRSEDSQPVSPAVFLADSMKSRNGGA